jgi:hypothetical protein
MLNHNPKIPSNRPHQRDHDLNQQTATAVRPPIPRDATSHMTRWQPGEMPKGGYRSVFDFSGTGPLDTKNSPTEGGGKKVY